ncbi:MAG TPA: ribonuclease Z [Chthoniobacterales bacterium]|nr:ribonuclease Z [Chthoniobacterales bacterium]
MASLIFLGTAPGYPTAHKNHTSLLLDTGTKKILIDAGEPSARSLLEIGLDPADLDAIAITHGHSDHTAGLPMVIQAAWIVGRQAPLPVFLPAELIDPLRSWLHASYISSEFLPFEIEFHAWEDTPVRSICGCKFTTTPTSHLQALVERFGNGRFHAFSFAVRHSSFEFVFSGDLGAPADLTEPLERGTDLLICEVAHFEPEALFEFLSSRRVTRLVLTHASAEVAAEVETVLEAARKSLPQTEVIYAADKMKLELTPCGAR